MTTPHTPTKAKPPASETVYKSTPVKKNLQGSEHYASLSRPDAELLHKNMATELAGQWVGPMPVEDFISTFLPTKSAIPKFDPKFFDALTKQTVESAMYDPFIKHVTTKAPKVIDGFKLINTSQYEDGDIKIPGMKSKPDISCYKKSCHVDPAHPTRYEDIELIFEFKPPRDQANPFVDRPTEASATNRFPFENQGESGRQCRGQIACYARVWCARQHRTHCFIVWIGDPLARIIRFDRSGGIVSEQFNYRENGDLLLKFLWSFSRSDDVTRGLDPTITKASPADAEKARLELDKWRPSSTRSVFKFQVPDSDADHDPEGNKKTRSFFVWGPLADPRSVTGRATRGYPAWDPSWDGGTGRVVFLKDSWRSCEPGVEKEVDILAKLNSKQCRNVPTLICGDDLENQTTVTKQFAGKTWNRGAKVDKFIKRVHTRFVEKEVGTHITSDLEMRNGMYSKRFLQIIFDAFIAHYDAYVKCGILHRDISAGNILVNQDGCGFLNDWDLSKHVDSDGVARQIFRSGTWQFMSAQLLMDPKQLNALHHDLESFFWVIVFHILRYMKTTIPFEKLEDKMNNLFDFQFTVQGGEIPKGGHVKASMFTFANPLDEDKEFEITDNIPLTTFYRKVLHHWRLWYQYVGGRRLLIDNAIMTDNVSRDEAIEMFPDYSNTMSMGSHRVMMQLFEAALAKETPWPQADRFVDRLAEPQKRERDEDGDQNQDGAGEDTGEGKGTASETGRPKKNMKLNDDAEYKGRGPIKPMPTPTTRQQTRLREMGSSGSHQT